MTVTLKTVDQVPGAPTVDGPLLSFQIGHVTAREIIRARVTTEVERHNSERQPRNFVGLVQPPPREQLLNPVRPERPRPLDAERQIGLRSTPCGPGA